MLSRHGLATVQVLLVASASLAFLAAGAAAKPASKRLRLRETVFKAPVSIPVALRYPVLDTLPRQLTSVAVSVTHTRRGLTVDVRDDGSSAVHVRSGSPAVIRSGSGDSESEILVFDVLGDWYACPANGWTSGGRTKFQVLDGDRDGVPGSEGDYVRCGGSPFAPVSPWARVDDNGEMQSLAVESDNGSYTVTLTPVPRPEYATDSQWDALLAGNRVRGKAGLAPLLLSEERCRGCQLHAEYLYLNKYSYRSQWDGVGSHDETPGNPGYTKEGREAARSAVTGGRANPADTISGQSRTVLHRINFLSDLDVGLGVGAVAKSEVDGLRGYSVVWCGKPRLSATDPPIVYPAPGATGIAGELKTERPRADPADGFYDAPRGLPISFTYSGSGLRDVSIKVYRIGRGGRSTELRGFLFSPEHPKHPSRPTNGRTAVFVPEAPLAASTRYAAKVVAWSSADETESVSLAWTFTTAK